MNEPGNDWPFGKRYRLQNDGINIVKITTVPFWPWHEPLCYYLEYDGANFFWRHNGQVLNYASKAVWVALHRAAEV